MTDIQAEVAAVKADASKVKAFFVKYGLAVAAFVVGVVLGHVL